MNIGASDYSNNGATIEGNVFGGNDAGSSPLGTMRVDVYKTAHNASNTCPTATAPDLPDTAGSSVRANYAIYGVYGGGNQASVLTGDSDLDCSGGTIYDNLYQGRITGSPSAWPVTPVRKSVVYIHGCDNTIMYVYGGGRAANTLNNTVTIQGGRFYQVYAGGNGSGTEVPGNPGANVVKLTGSIAPANCGDATVTINGGLINSAFGGSNSLGVVEGVASVDVIPTGDCPLLTKEVFGGGNEAPGGSVVVTIPCGATGLTDVYGGARNADIGAPGAGNSKNLVLNIYGGDMQRVFGGNMSGGTIYGNVTVNVHGSNPGHTIDEVFGGSNIGGNIVGDILVRVNDSIPGCPLQVNTVYGGGNLVAYEPDGSSTVSASRFSPKVMLINGTVNQDVFGGGYGSEAVVWANPQVVMGSDENNSGTQHTFTVLGNMYGGGSAAPVRGSTQVKLTSSVDHPVTVGTSSDATDPRENIPTGNGNIFGGGLGSTAVVYGNTSVGVFGPRTTVYHNIYGGGSAGPVGGSTDVQIAASEAFSIALPTSSIDADGKVTIASTTPGVAIRYNKGTSPTDPTTESGSVYSAAFQATAGEMVKAIAYRDGYTTSAVSTSSEVPIPRPTLSSNGTTATLTRSSYGATGDVMYYTLDGSTPDLAHVDGTYPTKTYSGSIDVSDGHPVVTAVTAKSGYITSEAAANKVATPTITISGTTATISCDTPNATLRYTLGTEDPGNPGTYEAPADPVAWTTATTVANGGTVTVASGQTIKVIAELNGFNTSHVASATAQ